MAYATKQKMIDLFGRESLRLMTGGEQEIDDYKLNAAIDAAEAEVNGYLAGAVQLPMQQVPEVVRLHACNIAYFYLDVDNPTEGAQARYKQATRFLERLQSGKAGLGLDDQGEQVTGDQGGVETMGSDPVFTRDSLRGF